MNIINHEIDLCDEGECINNLFCVHFFLTMQSCSFYFETVVKVFATTPASQCSNIMIKKNHHKLYKNVASGLILVGKKYLDMILFSIYNKII